MVHPVHFIRCDQKKLALFLNINFLWPNYKVSNFKKSKSALGLPLNAYLDFLKLLAPNVNYLYFLKVFNV